MPASRSLINPQLSPSPPQSLHVLPHLAHQQNVRDPVCRLAFRVPLPSSSYAILPMLAQSTVTEAKAYQLTAFTTLKLRGSTSSTMSAATSASSSLFDFQPSLPPASILARPVKLASHQCVRDPVCRLATRVLLSSPALDAIFLMLAPCTVTEANHVIYILDLYCCITTVCFRPCTILPCSK